MSNHPAPTSEESEGSSAPEPKSETAPSEAGAAAVEEAVEAAPAAPSAPATGEEETTEAAAAEAEDPGSEEIGRHVDGKVIGWNNGGFHVLVADQTAFCPRSEMETGRCRSPKSYLDKSLTFQILRIEEKGRRVVLSRAQALRDERRRKKKDLLAGLQPGRKVKGRVASLTDFGAFVDLGGLQGLIHVSEISRQRIGRPDEVLKVGQKVEVAVLKVEKGGKRISLSMKRLEPDPWKGIGERFRVGEVVSGRVEKIQPFGAFVALEPGLTGLLPSANVPLPRGSSLARMFPPGKEVAVQILSIDSRRRRISLALEGSKMEGSRADYRSYLRGQERSEDGFRPLAAALAKLQKRPD